MSLTDLGSAETERNAGFTREQLVDAIKQCGLQAGDIALVQVSHEALGTLGSAAASEGTLHELLYSALREVIGSEGTLIVPAFSLSFENGREFDRASPPVPALSGSSPGFVEYCLALPGARRSNDPNCSVVAVGPRAREILHRLPFTSYGKDCIYDRLLSANGKICGIGVPLAKTPFLHFVEESLDVPFRYRKLFTGEIRDNGRKRKQGWITSVPIQAPEAAPNGSRIESIARAEKICRVAALGSGEGYSVGCADFYELIKREIEHDPWITALGPCGDPIALTSRNSGSPSATPQLSPNASMEELISALWRLPRHLVSDGYDAALSALSTQIPMTIHAYPSGTECWTWLIPEKWTCDEAWLETLDGRRLFSYADNPLHVVSYSLPISRSVSREELFEHLHVHPKLPDAIPFIFKYYERDWGLCCSRNLKETLTDDEYRVVIRSRSEYGALKVGEVVIPGETEQTFVFCAHLCHPAMVNDDLSGVVVGIKVMQELLTRKNLKYTYRFIILPETIGSVAYLSHNTELVPKMIGGLFLEMLGLDNPHALQLSYTGDSRLDRCFRRVLKAADPRNWEGAFRTVVGNDERQFNAPGVRVPMLSLSRVKKADGGWPYYPEYHSSFDSPERASLARLGESEDLALRMIDALEQEQVPVNRFQGEIFCSRYGLNIDVYENREGNKALFDILFQIDGTNSIADIAERCRISVESVTGVVNQLCELGLVEYSQS